MTISSTDLAFLKASTILGQLPEGSGLDLLAADPAHFFCLAPGQELPFPEGGAPGLFVVVRGTVELILTDDQGNEKIVEFGKAGSFLREEGLFSGEARPYVVRALAATEMLHLPEEIVGEWVSRHKDFGINLLNLINRRIQYFYRDVFTQSTKNAPGRLVCYLLCQFDQTPRTADGSYLLRLPLPRKKLAARLGMTGEHMSRAFRQLREEGLLIPHPEGFFIPDVQRLSSYVCPAGCDW